MFTSRFPRVWAFAFGRYRWPSPSVSGEIANLVLNSQPGSFIGGGQDWDVTYTPENVGANGFFGTTITQTLPSGQPDLDQLYYGLRLS